MAMTVNVWARYALYVLFLLPGLTMATWVTRTPALRDGLSASTEQMGIILFGFSTGAMTGILSAGKLVERYGANRIILVGLMALSVGLCILASSVGFDSIACAFAGLFVVGVGLGWAEIAVNIEGAAVEREIRQPIMTTLHGSFSLGTLIGAVLGMAMTASGIALNIHLGFVAALCAVATLVVIRKAPRLSEQPQSEQQVGAQTSSWFKELRDGRLILIGYIVLAMALAEGAANDWLPLLMIDGHGFAETAGTLIYVAFTLGMTVGRFGGGVVIRRFGAVNTLRASAFVGALSLAVIVFSNEPWIAAAAVVAWGLGASLGFPLAISAAGASGTNSDLRVRLAATAGYLAFLVGPPMLGFIGEIHGLRLAMLPVLAVVAIAFVVASALKEAEP